MTENPKKILIVDDESQITRVLLRGLESAGYQVRTANDGRTGLESFRAWLPDLVITDISMPGFDGLELCSRIRQISEVPLRFELNRIALLSGVQANGSFLFSSNVILLFESKCVPSGASAPI